MNSSSGIKRGLAATAVAALAVTGVPALASSASATAGETLTLVGTPGPTLNGSIADGVIGGEVRLKVSSTVDLGDEGDLAVTNSNLTGEGDQNNANQNVEIANTTFIAEDSPGDSANDGMDEILVNVAVDLSAGVPSAAYALFLDDNGDGNVDPSEARVQIASHTTQGPLASVDVSPLSQSAAQGQPSGNYTVTLKDAQGRTTQLAAADTVDISSTEVTVNESDNSLDAFELSSGSATFTAESDILTPVANYPILVNPSSIVDPTGNVTAFLNVTKAADITAPEVDIVTAADNWDGFGDAGSPPPGAVTAVRVDQTSVRIDFKSTNVAVDANSTVTLTATGNGITFGGKPATTLSTVLDANGVGSITITPDAFSVQDGDFIDVTGSFDQILDFERAEATAVTAGASKYFGQLKGTVDVTASIADQFGLPITSGFIVGMRTGGGTGVPNVDAAPKVGTVGASGSVTLSFADTTQVNNGTDDVALMYFEDQYSPQVPPGDAAPGATTIVWTADGKGSDFTTSLDAENTGAPAYNPAAPAVTIVPLADANVSAANEALDLNITGGEAGVPVTITADNGALILATGQTTLAQGKASVTATTTGGGALPAGYQVVGTKSGLVTLTITSANRTETAQFTVAPQTATTAARNVTVSGEAEVPSGTTQAVFTAVVTDAFGNGIAGVPVSAFNIQVTGPAQFQDSDAVTNANGEIKLNVRLDSDAVGDVTIQVTGLPNGPTYQFGAAADQLDVSDTAPYNGAGLPVSANVATATTVVAVAEPVDPKLALKGKSSNGKDVITANAINKAAGAKATLWVNGDKKKSGTLDSTGNFTFSIKDKNGSKKTKYVVKISATDLTRKDQATKKQK